MSKVMMWSLVVVVLVLGGFFFYQNSTKNQPEQNNSESMGTFLEGTEGDLNDTEFPGGDELTSSGKKIAFSELVKQGGSYMCSVNQYVNDTSTKGLVYMSGDLIRGEFKSQAQGINVDSTLIVKNGYTYSWTSLAPSMGFKAKSVVGEADPNQSVSTAGSYSWNAEQIGDYDCSDWVPDMSMFDLPSGVSFQELN